jgi:4-amino-4-deoxy-L-arabinose transferase-like glycosyltransferase
LVVFGCFVAFVAVWTTYAAVTGGPEAIHGDMAEAFVWGREFQLGYYKHPPFWSWVAGVWFYLAPRAGWSFDLLCVLNAALGLLGAWRLVGDFTKADRRMAATALLLLTPFYTFLSLKYNANSIFLSIWPWTLHYFVRSIDERRLGDAIGFGVFMALAMLSKYFSVLLGLSCLVAACLHPDRGRYFRSPAPYVSTAVGLALFSPHVWWLVQTGFGPFHYLGSETHRSLADSANFSARTISASIAYHLIVIGVVLAASRTRPADWIAASRRRWRDPRFRFQLALVLTPVALTAVFGVVLHIKASANMLIGVFPLAPLTLIELVGVTDDQRLRRMAVRSAIGVSLAALLLSPVIAYEKIWFVKDPSVALPRIELAREATRIWRQRTGQPLVYVAGGDLYPDAVAFYSPDRPHAFIGFDFHLAPWVTPADLARHGLLAVCLTDDQPCQANAVRFSTPGTVRTTLTVNHSFWGHSRAPKSFVLYLTAPRAAPAS